MSVPGCATSSPQVKRASLWPKLWQLSRTSVRHYHIPTQAVVARLRTIENGRHDVRAVTLGEDACQMHQGAAPQALAAVRNVVISLVRHAGWTNVAGALHHDIHDAL